MKTEEYDDFPPTKIPRVDSRSNAVFAAIYKMCNYVQSADLIENDDFQIDSETKFRLL